MIYIARGKRHVQDINSGKLLILHNKNIKNAFYNHGKEVVEELEKLITTGSRSGRTYSFRGKRYKASAPGEPPANRSGRLAKSFIYRARTRELIVASTAFSDKGAPYPAFLDEGTGKMEARPYFKITNEKNFYKLERDLRDFI